MHIYAAGLP